MATERIERIVVAEPGLKMADSQVADRRDDQAHDQRRPRLDKACAGRDHHKARNQTGAGTHQRGATGMHTLDGKPRDHARRAGRHGVKDGKRRHGVGLKLAAAVKAKPAKPKQPGAQRHKRYVMRAVAHHAKASASAEHQAENQTRQTGRDVHHVAAGKVERADDVADKGALAAPNHVGKRRIDHEQPNAQEGRHGTKHNAAGQAARDDSGGDHGKRHLEGDVDDLRVDGTVRGIALGRLQHLVEYRQAQQLFKASNKRAGTVAAIGQRPAGNNPQHTNQANGAKAHKHGVDDIFAPGQAAIEKRQTRCH